MNNTLSTRLRRLELQASPQAPEKHTVHIVTCEEDRIALDKAREASGDTSPIITLDLNARE